MKKMKKITWILALVLVAVLSVTKVSGWASNPATHAYSIEQTERNISTVLKLSAGASVASVVLTVLPGDVGTPMADQFAEMSKYFLLILSILYLEKYLIPITGYAAFTVLVPVVCAVLIGYICTNKKALLKLAGKILLCAIAIFAVIPASVKISDIIYQTQETSINSTIEEMNSLDSAADESGSILDKIKETASNAKSLLSGLITDLIESLAVMLTITCLIPVLVFLFFAWLIKMVFISLATHIDEEAVRRIARKPENEE
jgi:hypothetical protein